MSINILSGKVDELETLTQETSSDTEIFDKVINKVRRNLIRAFYLWFWWIHPDGSWTPWHHWWSKTDYRHRVIESEFQWIKESQNPQEKINELLSRGRQYFSDEEYEQVYPMFRLLFVLEKRNVFNQRILDILQEMNDSIPETFPNIPEFIGYAGENSYTEDEKKEMQRMRLIREQEAKRVRLEKERTDNERVLRLRARIQDYLMEKWICPDCKVKVPNWWDCPKCRNNIYVIPF